MSAAARKRALPNFSRWGTGLWAFAYRYVTYFACQDSSDWWWVVAQDDQSTMIGPGGRSKAAAVRAALDAIDGEGQDQEHERGAA